jgi:hypothetical protein
VALRGRGEHMFAPNAPKGVGPQGLALTESLQNRNPENPETAGPPRGEGRVLSRSLRVPIPVPVITAGTGAD